MACPSEEDRQSLQRTKESFENRWTYVRRTVASKRRQAEERLLLYKEFWNEYEKFVEWINETENAVKKSDEAMPSGLEVSRSRLKRFEVSFRLVTVVLKRLFYSGCFGRVWFCFEGRHRIQNHLTIDGRDFSKL